MTTLTSEEIRVCVDVGCYEHQVLIGLTSGTVLSEFRINHKAEGFDRFFKEVEAQQKRYNAHVLVAMEAYNGYARPLDSLVIKKGFTLYNVNNYKLAQFKKVFPAPAKTDKIDARKIFEMVTLKDHLQLKKGAVTPIMEAPEINLKLKRLTRRREAIIKEKVALSCRMQSDLQACIPGILEITGSVDNIWFLNLLVSRKKLNKLATMQKTSLLKIRGIGAKYASTVKDWQKTAVFSDEIEWVNDMILRDAARLLVLLEEIKAIDSLIEKSFEQSVIAKRINTICGFGIICSSTLAGEIGCIHRFKTEASLALYLGMAVLDNSSGEYEGTKKCRHVNVSSKRVMMIGVARHIDLCPESKLYYDKKRKEGKKHNQAVRALGRHLSRVMFSMLSQNRDYVARLPQV